mmetsp:Transcript_10528/g.22515  ORF Transcript_10528/g.22515 Transcript_10528/m.22515 type:complete len:944 (+) Transcript_10528:278-3109(+)
MDDSVIEETRGSGNNSNGNNGLTGEHPASNEEIQENEDLNQENDSGTSSDRDEEEEVEVGNDENVINNEDDDYSVLTIPLVDALMREGLNWDGDSNGSIESDESDIGEGTSGEPEDGVVANLNNENSNNANGRGRELRNRYLEFLLGRYDGSGHDEGENNDYGDEDNFDDDDNDNESLRQARDHSYLPTAQPLYPEEWIPAGRHRVKQQRFDSSGNKKNEPERVTEESEEEVDMAAEIDDSNIKTDPARSEGQYRTNREDNSDHIFPHYTIPELPRPQNISASWTLEINHDTRTPRKEVQHATTLGIEQSSTPTLILAILEIDDVILFPGATLPLRLRDPNWLEYLVPLIDDARGLFGAHPMGEVRIGILPRIADGIRRTRRLPREFGGRTGRWRVDLIRRGITWRRPRMRITGQDETTVSNGDVSERGNTVGENRDASVAGRDQQQIQGSQRSMGARISGASQNYGGDGSRSDSQQSYDEGEDDYFHPTVPPINSDPLVGRVGTMATITFTHEEALLTSSIGNESETVLSGRSGQSLNRQYSGGSQNRPRSMVWQQHRGELVVTALGTNRFRVVRSSSEVATKNRQPSYQGSGVSNNIPLYIVEVWDNGNLLYPPTWMTQMPGNGRFPLETPFESTSEIGYDGDTSTSDDGEQRSQDGACSSENINITTISTIPYLFQHDNVIQNLCLRSSVPSVAYHAMWPWRIGDKICNLILATDQLQGLKSILPSAAGVVTSGGEFFRKKITQSAKESIDTCYRVVDPSAFANWLASNMPLGVNDRLDLLVMPTAIQQLRYILKKIQKQRETMLRCKHCGALISPMRNVFTVGGAEGTTGAYVNEHGIVHQTVTLRSVDNRSVVCTGRPETKDSWFPGYSWDIAYCTICYSHLGWQFRSVKGKRRAPDPQAENGVDEQDPDRPQTFWGFSAVTTDEKIAPRRVFRSRRL